MPNRAKLDSLIQPLSAVPFLTVIAKLNIISDAREGQVVELHLLEGGFFEGLRSLFEHGVKRLQLGEHSRNVPFAEVESTGLLQTFVPLLVPQDGRADQLVRYHDGLDGKEGSLNQVSRDIAVGPLSHDLDYIQSG